MDILELMRKNQRRINYSERTIETYCKCVGSFLNWCNKEPRKITKKDVRLYLEYLCDNKKAASTLNVHLQAIKYVLEKILNKKFFVRLPYSKIPQRLPEILTKEEVKLLFEGITKPKHKLMIQLMYSAGLRVGELVKLRIKDFCFNNGYGWVRGRKGNKDRIFIISKKLSGDLLLHIQSNDLLLEEYLFEGRRKKHISIRTIQQIIKHACRRASIRKKVHPHTLRHSFATHLIENGYDLSSVQALLGHKSLDTTMVYVHISSKKFISVKSPFDDLE